MAKITFTDLYQWGTEGQPTIYVDGATLTVPVTLAHNLATGKTVTLPPPVEPEPKPSKKWVFDPPTLVIGGVLVSRSAVQQAIDLLTAATSNSVSRVLGKAEHPLAGVDVHAIAAEERLYSAAFDKGKDKTKAAFIHHLRNALAGVRRIPENEFGYLVPVVAPQTWTPFDETTMRKCIRQISKAFGRGRIVGQGAAEMNPTSLNDWLTAWHGGDLETAYAIEAAVADPGPHHPGQNPLTGHVIWAPAVTGEVPAGEAISGNWPSPQTHWGTTDVDNYLIQARMAHPTHLSGTSRRNWIYAHLRGDKATVDRLSLTAKHRAETGAEAATFPPIATNPPKRPDLDAFLTENTPPNLWTTGALAEYIDLHGLDTMPTWQRTVRAVTEFLTFRQAEQQLHDYDLTLAYAPQQPALGGFHRKAVLVDQFDRRWLFKPAPSPQARFRPEVEHEAHQLAVAWGFRTAHSQLVDFDGHYGQIQLMLPVDRDLLGCTGAQFADLTEEQLTAVACEHALDWALDNDDTHGGNMVILTDGTVIGIDKGRAWRYVGGWDGLSATTTANTNCQVIYTDLYAAIAAGHLDRALVDRMYRAVIVTAHRMQALPDQALHAYLTRATANRPHYQPSSYQTPIAGAPTTAAELITQVTDRKNRLVADMRMLWERVYTAAGWTPPELHFPLGFNAQGHELHAGLSDPALHQAITRTKSYGTATFVAGTGVEDAHVLLWRERRPDGHYNIRGHFKVRAETLDTMAAHYRDEWAAISKATMGPPPLDETGLYTSLRDLMPVVNETANGWSHWLPTAHTYFDQFAGRIAKIRHTAATALAEAGPDPEGRLEATVAMCDTYTAHLALLKTRLGERAPIREWECAPYAWTPNPVPPPPLPLHNLVRTGATRAAATLMNSVQLANDGELHLSNAELDQETLLGHMYLTNLATGEEIEFRPADNAVPLSVRGTVQFTVKDANDLAGSLARIAAYLAERGCDLTPATPDDLELFYWRHLANVMRNRADAKPVGASTPPGHLTNPAYHLFWQRFDKDAADELGMWRHAFDTIVTGPVDEFLAAGGHLPRFQHQDLRRPGQPCGKPFWYRPDVTRVDWTAKKLLSLHYRSGPRYILATGIAASTETRIRAFAIWKGGQSSSDDMKKGSGAFVFARANRPTTTHNNVYISPQTFTRTSTYTYDSDRYGRLEDRISYSYFDFGPHTDWSADPNEVMIKDAVSLLDDIEVLVFDQPERRKQAIKALAKLGITAIRGIPVLTRFVGSNELALIAAVKAVRTSYTQPW